MERRSLLAASVGLAGTLAGCSGLLGDFDDGDDSGPDDTAEAFLQALFAGNVDEANAYLSDDSRMNDRLGSLVDVFAQQRTQLEGTSVRDRQGNRAMVEATTSITSSALDQRVERPLVVLLVRVGGSWRVSMVTTPGFGEGPPSAPSVQWESSERTAGERTSAIVFRHGGGDDVTASTLSARVDGVTASAPSDAGSVQAGDEIVVPLDAPGDAIPEPIAVELLWTSPETGTTQTLGIHTAGSRSVGALADRLRMP